MSWTESKILFLNDFDLGGKGVRDIRVEVSIQKEDCIYGSDADGRRGEKRIMIEDFDIVSILDLETGEDLTKAFKTKITSMINKQRFMFTR